MANMRVDEPTAVAVFDRPPNAGPQSGSSRTSLPVPAGASTIRNIVANIVGNVVCAGVGIVLTPILIHGLGDFQYGLWSLSLALLGSYGLIDTGLRITMQRFVARFKGLNEREALDQVLATVLALMAGTSILICALTPILISVLPGFFHIGPESRSLFHLVMSLLAATIAFTLPSRALTTYLSGLQRFDLFNLGSTIVITARAALIVAVLHLGYGLLGVASATLLVEMFSVALYWYLVRRADPGASFHWRNVQRSRMRELAGFSVFAYLGNAGDYLRCSTDSAVISHVLTVALVTPFTVAGRLMDNFRGLIAAFGSPLMPRMSEFDGQARTTELKEFFFRSTKMTALVSFFIGSLVLLDGKSLLRLWVGERFVSSYGLLVVLTTGYMLVLAQAPSGGFLYAKGRHHFLGWWTLGEGAANLVLSIYWARKYGIVGVALGTMVPMLVTGLLILPLYVARLLEVPILRYIREAFAGPVLTCALFVAVSQIVFAGQMQTRLKVFAPIVVCQSALFALLAYAVGLNKTERRHAHDRCRQFAVVLGL
jgi:O-antigen/teichoic acid export membrane protein